MTEYDLKRNVEQNRRGQERAKERKSVVEGRTEKNDGFSDLSGIKNDMIFAAAAGLMWEKGLTALLQDKTRHRERQK